MKTPAAFAATALFLALSAGAASAADTPAKSECFWQRNVTSFASPDDHTVYIKVNQRDVYRLDLMVSCPDVDWNQRVGLKSSPGGVGSICGPMDIDIVSHATGIGAQRCPVKAMTKLTPAEIAALPKRAKP